jgi:hypothetical protein
VHWLERVCKKLSSQPSKTPVLVEREMLSAEESAEWEEWLPAQAIWLPLIDAESHATSGGVLLAREEPWQESDTQLLEEWRDIWWHAWTSKHAPAKARGITRWFARRPGAAARRSFWHSPLKRYGALLLLCLLIPVRLTVLVPGELVPAQPAAIRAPLDGTVDRFFVAPNALVKAGDPLFQLDLTTLTSKLNVALQELATADAEYRQSAQQAVADVKSKALLATLNGRILEHRTEVEYLRAQLGRAQVAAPRDGIALVDDPSEWIGKPVMTGEKVLTIADEHDVEVEAWLAPGDAIEMPVRAAITLYLNAEPLNPVRSTLRYAAHEAIARPDGSFAYRVRAVLAKGERQLRVGLKGTARISGGYVPLVYLILRRPLATLRPYLGI